MKDVYLAATGNEKKTKEVKVVKPNVRGVEKEYKPLIGGYN